MVEGEHAVRAGADKDRAGTHVDQRQCGCFEAGLARGFGQLVMIGLEDVGAGLRRGDDPRTGGVDDGRDAGVVGKAHQLRVEIRRSARRQASRTDQDGGRQVAVAAHSLNHGDPQ